MRKPGLDVSVTIDEKELAGASSIELLLIQPKQLAPSCYASGGPSFGSRGRRNTDLLADS
jgi:hypothetical protein